MPKASEIVPRRVVKNGAEMWVVRCPKDIRGGRQKRKFFHSKTSATAYCGELMESRNTLSSFWHRLNPQQQEIIVRLLARFDGDAGQIERMVDLGVKQCGTVTVPLSDALDQFIAAKEAKGVSKHQMRNYKALKKQLLLKFNGTVGELSGPILSDWIASRFENPGTRNHKRGELMVFLSFLKQRDIVPLSARWSIPAAIEPARDVEIFTPDEMKALFKLITQERGRFNYLRNSIVPFVAIGGFAGLRHSEVERLDWSDISLSREIIHVRPSRTKRTKNTTGRVIPIQPVLKAWLSRYEKKSGPVVEHKKIYDVLLDWCRREKFEWKRNGLRHSFTSYRIAVTQSEQQVATEIGDLVSTMKKHYKQAVDPKIGKEWFAIMPGK